MTPDDLRRKLEFYQDLGIKDLYRRPPSTPLQSVEQIVETVQAPMPPKPKPSAAPPSAPPAPLIEPAASLPALAPAGDTLLKIIEDMGDCRRCRLHAGRNKIVFGVGNEKSPLVFVGEGPGADEDAQGFPFVGRA